ncbi:MAG: DNA-binding protein [Lachnospiraceae bacterium]|nr:DNA-binding protein [Lachnospiraceae bacterium]
MDGIIDLGRLYDFYGELLTVHQRQIYEAAVYEDLSLNEIAKENGITKQGVHDLIRRCTRTMEAYEEKLHMIERFQRLQALCEETSTLCQDASLSREELAAETEEKLQLMLQAISQD